MFGTVFLKLACERSFPEGRIETGGKFPENLRCATHLSLVYKFTHWFVLQIVLLVAVTIVSSSDKGSSNYPVKVKTYNTKRKIYKLFA